MKAKAVVRLRFPSKKHQSVVFKALEPEVKKPATTRSRVTVEREGMSLMLKVEASDTVALRAALNSYLRWINSTTEILKVLETL